MSSDYSDYSDESRPTHPLIQLLFRKALGDNVTPVRDIKHEELCRWLRTPVAHHMLDSGDYYGRQYQANRFKNYAAAPPVSYEFDYTREDRAITTADIIYSVSLYHYLKETCGFDAITDAVNEFVESNPDDEGLFDAQVGGGFNVYNECNTVLSSIDNIFLCVAGTFSGTIPDYESDSKERVYASISVHGGCDPRGGFQEGKLVALKVPYFVFTSGAEVSMRWDEWDSSEDGYRNTIDTRYDGHTLRDESGEYTTIIDYVEYPAEGEDDKDDDDEPLINRRFGGYLPVMPEKVAPRLDLWFRE